MDSRYTHQQFEEKVYDLWEKDDAFNPDSYNKKSVSKSKQTAKTQTQGQSFCIMMPPPNANDSLHIGHAMFISLEDVFIRFHRMLGEDTLWLPGTDHAGIETQFLYEKKLQKKGQSRFDFDRQTLYQNIWQYVQENSDVAVNQMKKIGASADWSRFCFMLDEKIVKIVLETFFNLHKKNLVYRDLKLVNYCTHCGTSFSELEVDHLEQKTPLYYVKYQLVDKPNQHITVATVRPEPIWADTHLAVNPKDATKQNLIGTKVYNPLTNAVMTIIADDFVDPAFGTGIVKLTPAHDPNDFELAKKQNLPINRAITPQGKIAPEGGVYAGLSVKKARAAVVADLETKNALERIDTNYINTIGVCYRCGRPLEPLPLAQFFIKVKPLTEPVLAALKNKTITVHGAGHDKILKHWLETLKDWNVSRQIVWGIRMPVWYNTNKNSNIAVTFLNTTNQPVQGTISDLLEAGHSLESIKQGLQNLTAPPEAEYQLSITEPGPEYIQETDTFDTWFSSAQWPFSTLQATSSEDFTRFYPTQLMETGYDILPFWVMRMLLIGQFATRKLPFDTIYLHGLIRDEKGRKMSKSKGNVINPLVTIEQYGADALRMALIIRSTAGLDKSVGPADFKAMRNLTNKLWNAARYVLQSTTASDNTLLQSSLNQKIGTQFEQKLSQIGQDVTQQLKDYKPGLAADTLYAAFWHWYCDKAIEQHKQEQLDTQQLLTGLLYFLKLFHPFMPFVTEAIWQELHHANLVPSSETSLLIRSAWPATME